METNLKRAMYPIDAETNLMYIEMFSMLYRTFLLHIFWTDSLPIKIGCAWFSINSPNYAFSTSILMLKTSIFDPVP